MTAMTKLFSAPGILTATSFLLLFLVNLFISGCASPVKIAETVQDVPKIPAKVLVKTICLKLGLHRSTQVDSILIDSTANRITVQLSREAAFAAIRENTAEKLQSDISSVFDEDYPGYAVMIKSAGYAIEEYIPNYFRSSAELYDKARIPLNSPELETPLIQNLSKSVTPLQGLFNRNIVLWQSHGWYYSNDQKRWEWQRPRLFESVEDLVPASIVLPYLVPMLQNAGANVWLPRERSTQFNEVVVDNDKEHQYARGLSQFKITGASSKQVSAISPGFMMARPVLDSSENPFTMGSYIRFPAGHTQNITVSYIPEIPESGIYPVYISYHADTSNIHDAEYIVYHTGGATRFLVNQTIGGKTWTYLGDFHFHKGIHPDSGKVEITNVSAHSGKYVTTDAVRFGAGFGLVNRGGATSGMPKYIEGARYWLQYAGMPDTIVYNLNRNRKDYNDDYQSRAEYANYLYGSPNGPNRDINNPGLKIPIDLSLAFHTDAGITKNDSIIGTLLIYSTRDNETGKYFADGVSRMANRDFADVLQTQIVNDIRLSFDSLWTRRELRDAEYSESWRPNMPGALLELLSHQNLADMILFKDPRFRFTVARAIYKGMLRYLSTQYNISYTVQPLPVTHFSAKIISGNKISLSWKSRNDEYEPTAAPSGFLVYTATEDGGYDNGIYTDSHSFTADVKPGTLYRFKITAANNGGESFATPELVIYSHVNPKGEVALIDGFSRVSGPQTVRAENFSGFLSNLDPGVPDYYDLSFTGYQHDFNPKSKFITNDRPGHGASGSEFEKFPKQGNSHNNLYQQALLYRGLGYSVSSSNEDALASGNFELSSFRFVELVYEKQKTTSFPGRNMRLPVYSVLSDSTCNKLERYLSSGGALLISGEYLGSDIHDESRKDTLAKKFTSDFLKWRWAAPYAQNPSVKPITSSFWKTSEAFSIQLDLNSGEPFMNLQSADSFYPAAGGQITLRYSGNDFGAAIAFKQKYKVLSLGFPFSKIKSDSDKRMLLQKFLEW